MRKRPSSVWLGQGTNSPLPMDSLCRDLPYRFRYVIYDSRFDCVP
jgi:hypothetical protein